MPSQARPVFLDLTKIRLPINALVSILHRVTGVLMILSIPVVLWLFGLSVAGPEQFTQVAGMLRHPLGSLLLLAWLWLLMHHFFVGIRFLLVEVGVGETREGGRQTAWSALVAGVVSAILVWALFL